MGGMEASFRNDLKILKAQCLRERDSYRCLISKYFDETSASEKLEVAELAEQLDSLETDTKMLPHSPILSWKLQRGKCSSCREVRLLI